MGTLVVVLLLAVAGWIAWKLIKDPDKNDDGVVDHKDVVAAAKEVAVDKVKKARKPKAPKA